MKSQGTQHVHELERYLLSLACESLYVGGQINGQIAAITAFITNNIPVKRVKQGKNFKGSMKVCLCYPCFKDMYASREIMNAHTTNPVFTKTCSGSFNITNFYI